MATGKTITDIYLDNHSTTKVDPRAVEAMMPWFELSYANPGSVSHVPGRNAKELLEEHLGNICGYLGACPDELIVTSGATESTNLAILGAALHPRQKRRKIVTLATEHHAVLGPVEKLSRLGWETVTLSPFQHGPLQNGEGTAGDKRAGLVDLNRIADAIDSKTALVSIMLANNEIGVIQPLREISEICSKHGVLLHTDATQAVGKMPVNIEDLGVDLLSFSAHKFYGPKGVGGLIVSQHRQLVELSPQIVGGGQQLNLRSGTLNSPGIVGMAVALEICINEMSNEAAQAISLRNLLWRSLLEKIPGLMLNGPDWSLHTTASPPNSSTNADARAPGGVSTKEIRLAGNLNVCFPKIDGQSLMLAIPGLSVSSGSACTATHPEPSHVLRGIGRTDDQARSSIRFGVGRFNSEDEIRLASAWIADAYHKLLAFVA
ncbi:cysteine desulfurase family protein [Pirellulaceae bacterium SH449]